MNSQLVLPECSRPSCKNPAREGYRLCEKHAERAREHSKEGYAKLSPEKKKEYIQKQAERQKLRDRTNEYRNPKGLARSRAYNLRRRIETLEAYGGMCVCCKEAYKPFLTLHHPNNDGQAHREELTGNGLTGGTVLYNKLRDLGYPPGIDVLCFNCHFAITNYGECPHQTREWDIAKRFPEKIGRWP